MSRESYIHIYTRLNALEVYIQRIPKEVGAGSLQGSMKEVMVVFPVGRWYKHVLADLRGLMPETIDEKLRGLETSCGKLVEPYRAHIEGEVQGILADLERFRQMGEKETGGDGGVSEEETFSVVSRKIYEGRFGDSHEVAIRRYGPADGPAVYQEWIDGKFQRTLPVGDATTATQQQDRMPEIAHTRGLLSRLKELAA